MENSYKLAKRHCLFTMFAALIVIVCVCIGVVMNLTTIYDENFDHMGLRTFCMFTVNSNILCAIAMALVVPYTVDGLRKHNFHAPKWVMVMELAGVTATTLTFLVSLFILAPVKGFVLIFSGSRFFLHGLCPVLAIIAFCFFMTEQELTVKNSLIALIPVFIYAVVYTFMVLLLGAERGGWEDFYGFFTRLKVWIPLVAILPVTFIIATVLRVLHNNSRNNRHKKEAAFYKEVFKDADLPSIVAALARLHKKNSRSKDILIPGRVIAIMDDNNEGEATWRELCEIYLKEYLDSDEVMDIQKLWM